MPWKKVTPVLLDYEPGELCKKRYPGHPAGCPNYGRKKTCPPQAELWTPKTFEEHDPCVIWNVFPLDWHVRNMRAKHPDWSQRQLECCLYWQGTARSRLKDEITLCSLALDKQHQLVTSITSCPEAHGVNVTETMAKLGIALKWPPKEYAIQVAIAFVNGGGS